MVRDVSGHEVEALHYELLLREIVAAAEKLPPFPDVIWKVMPLIQRMAPAAEIEGVIKYDQAITARILALSQSAYYGRKTPVDSIKDAIVTLGNQKLVQVILTASAACYFDRGASRCDPTERELWHHSVATAVVSEMVARTLRYKKILKVYMAALLHDIGKTVLNFYIKIYRSSSQNGAARDKADIPEIERRTLGVDHQALGKRIALRWRLPPEVVAAVGYHHCPFEAQTDQDAAAIVYVANQMVLSMGANEQQDEEFDPDRDEIFRELGITSPKVQRFQEQLIDIMDEVQQFLSSDAGSCSPKVRTCRADAGSREKRRFT